MPKFNVLKLIKLGDKLKVIGVIRSLILSKANSTFIDISGINEGLYLILMQNDKVNASY